MDEEMLTVKEAAELLGVNHNTIYQATLDGRLPFTLMYGRKVIKRSDIETYRERTRVGGAKPKGRPPKSGPTKAK